MNIQYAYEIIKVDEAARCMEVVYSANGHQTMHISARLPFVGETFEDIVQMFAPVSLWIERATPVVVPQVGTKGDVMLVAGQMVATPKPTTSDAEARNRRDRELAASDWSVLADTPLDQTARELWVEYRQLLRDVPRQGGFPDNIVWPLSPATEAR